MPKFDLEKYCQIVQQRRKNILSVFRSSEFKKRPMERVVRALSPASSSSTNQY